MPNLTISYNTANVYDLYLRFKDCGCIAKMFIAKEDYFMEEN